MEKRQIIRVINIHPLVQSIIGTALYGLLSWSANTFPLPAVQDITFRPGVAVLIFFGIAYGPWVGLLVGFLGNTLGDVLSNWGFYWNWSLGYGIMGMVAGFFARANHNFRAPAEILKAICWGTLGIAVGLLFASLTQVVVSDIDLTTALQDYFKPFFIGDFAVIVILLPILMIAFAAVAAHRGR